MKFAVVFPWPGIKNAEYEFIKRLQHCVKKINHHLVVIDNDGFLLDDETLFYKNKNEKLKVDHNSLEFVLSLHFDSRKTIDSFWYTANWNPPKFLLENDFDTYVDNYLSSDDFLIYDADKMTNFLKLLLSQDDRGGDAKYFDGATKFLPSTPDLGLQPPNCDNYKLFYCGINWERCSSDSGRHQGLFELLDKTSYMQIHGPNKFLGVRPWRGFKSFCGELPFDGISSIKKINECGVALILSSEAHMISGSASSRLYEACAAGAIIISDRNPFVVKHFDGKALFIDTNGEEAQETFKQIDNWMKWIKLNPVEARNLAQEAQNYWRKEFTLEKQVTVLCEKHYERKKYVGGLRYSKNRTESIDIVVPVLDNSIDHLKDIFHNINSQIYTNFRVHIICDESLSDQVKSVLPLLTTDDVYVHPLKVFIGGVRVSTTLQMLSEIKDKLESKYFTIFYPNMVWFKDDLELLKRSIEDSNIQFAYSKLDSEINSMRFIADKSILNLEVLKFAGVIDMLEGFLMYCLTGSELRKQIMLFNSIESSESLIKPLVSYENQEKALKRILGDKYEFAHINALSFKEILIPIIKNMLGDINSLRYKFVRIMYLLLRKIPFKPKKKRKNKLKILINS